MTPAAPPSPRAGTAPPLLRGAMTPAPWFGFWRGVLFALWPGQRWSAQTPAAPWHAAARRRRRVLAALVLAMSAGALALRLDALPADAGTLWWATTALMTLLFAWVGVGCATAIVGAWAAWRGDTFTPRLLAEGDELPDPQVRTAIVMPICNEDIASVFAGLRATCESLATTGAAAAFDVFVLSDTSRPELRAAEQRAFARLCTMLGDAGDGSGRLFYRWRKRRVKRKAGNVADFCRRWGRGYRYMIVLDADSTMSGRTLVDLVLLMQQQPRAGIIQTLPQVANPGTLHARAQQFASRVTGRLFALGMSWWQLGDAHYWGHNAIIRVEPFMRHCALARLPGRGGLAGEILSHDFVEAALMGRMGYEVWLAPQLEGSWEQSPSNLLDELQRDRRWCQGNLQNLRLVAEPGWRGAHRMMFAVGALSYGVAPLWLVFLALGLGGRAPIVGPSGGGLSGDQALWLLTLLLLLLPRVLSAAAVVLRGEAAAFGGTLRLALGALLELLLSTFQAPLRMLAHCVYVLGAFTGLKLEWKSPPRGDDALGWGDATRRVGSLVALPLLAGVGLVRRAVTLTLAPMLLPLTLAVPFTVLTGHPRAGRVAQRLGLLRTPEDRVRPQPLLRAAESAAFGDLVPATPAPLPPPQQHRRFAPALAMMAVAVCALAVPRMSQSPELSAAWHNEQQVAALWDAMLHEPSATTIAPAPPKRVMAAVRHKPARMIDDAVRRRAIEAVERAIAAEDPPA
ncbi:MAG: glucans biosynthesis glucosyltransferase MdoH [Ideonella sp.]|nr:glucans biosynthesis glucosyltransferase MdoH [Ideonella sp.]MCC7455387.1 glucans biosynthesis glucosyltransferase MdoH [Nitrospira sp.]